MNEIDEKDLEQTSGGFVLPTTDKSRSSGQIFHINTYGCNKFEKGNSIGVEGTCSCCVHAKRVDYKGIYFTCDLGVE